MLIDARALAADTTLTADVCIVGGGAAGITLALELIGTGLRTIVVESGGTSGPDAATQDLAAGESVGRPVQTLTGPLTLDMTRLRWLGGTTNHWAGFCRPLEPIDFEPRDHLAVSGWPIERSTLVPYWSRAADYCRITDGEDEPAVWARRAGLPSALAPTASVRTTVFQVTPFMRFGEIYLDELDSTEEVEVLLWANTVNLATSDGAHVDGIDIRTLAGGRARIEARAYVLAAGGLENPRLLLASADADPAGVGNARDQVGRHFAEHLQVTGGFGVLDVDPDDLRGYTGTDVAIPTGRFAGELHGVKYALALSSDHVREARTLGMEAQVIVGSLPAGVPAQADGVTAADVADLVAAVTGDAPGASLYVQVLAEQALDPDSRVTLASARDALGMRRVRLDWRHGRADRLAILNGLQTIAEQLGGSGVGRLQLLPGGVVLDGGNDVVDGEFITLYGVDLEAVDPADFRIGVGFHHMCTTRMADSPDEGVVDADCRVHGVDNLWITGSSVFATGGVATPTLTIVALAIRLADHLRAGLG